MRVVAGSAKGRRLRTVPGRAVRPTAGRVREAIFSMLESRGGLAGATVLDLYAGTGALGIEALSRGAVRAVFVERDRRALEVLRENVARCGFGDRVRIRAEDAERAVRALARTGARFDGVFLDPPYGGERARRMLARVAAAGLVRPGGWVVVEHDRADVLDAVEGLRLTRRRCYGKTRVSVFVRPVESTEG